VKNKGEDDDEDFELDGFVIDFGGNNPASSSSTPAKTYSYRDEW